MAQEIIAERYKVISTLGSGGMGVVYRALDISLDKEVAVKTIRSNSLTGDQLRRFQTEAVALSNLKHPNIVDIMVCGLTEDNVAYLVMSFVEGKSLASLIESRGYIHAYKSVNFFIDLADGLAHAHKNGVIHRDLKPANIVLSDAESLHPRPIVVDFGIARLENQSSQSLTRPGAVIGTPVYMSPEQFKGTTADVRSDIYSFGCVMFETLTGKRPFEGETDLVLMESKLSQTAPSLNDVVSYMNLSFPTALEKIVAKSLRTDPDDRFQSMGELRDALIAFREGELLEESRKHDATAIDTTQIKRTDPRKTRLIVLTSALTLVIAGIAATAIFGLLGGQKGSDMAPVSADLRFKAIPLHGHKGKQDDSVEKASKKPEVKFERGGHGNMLLTISAPLEVSLDLSDAGLMAIIGHRKLSSLKVNECKFDGNCFEKLQDHPLVIVELSDTGLTDRGLTALCKIKTIRELKLKNQSRLSAAAIAQIASLTNLKRLELINCKLTDDHLKKLRGLKKLRSLHIDENQQLTGDALEFPLSCPNLILLHLGSDPNIEIDDLRKLQSLKHLSRLWLSDRNLKDSDVEKLVRILPNLTRLHIPHNPNITIESVKSAVDLKRLDMLNLEGTQAATDKARVKNILPHCTVHF